MARYFTPGVYFEQFDTSAGRISAVRTDIPGFVGIAEKGPLDEPVKIESWKQFTTVFGGFTVQGYLAYAVYGFFENGGSTCYVTRAADRGKASCAYWKLKDKNGANIAKVVSKTPGAWGNKTSINISRTGAGKFSLIVVCGDSREVFKDLTFDPSDRNRDYRPILKEKRYFADDGVINHMSSLIRVEDLRVLPVVFPATPDDVFNMEQLAKGSFRLAEGKDGIATLEIFDLIGLKGDEEKRGLRCYEDVDAVSMVCIPDIMIRPAESIDYRQRPSGENEINPCLPDKTEKAPLRVLLAAGDSMEQPPVFSEDDVFTAQLAMVEHCENLKDRFAVLDMPCFSDSLEKILEWREKFDTSYAAMYYPWIKVENPLRFGGTFKMLLPPSGHVAGVYARCDLKRGVHKAPANEKVFGAVDMVYEVDNTIQDILNPKGINCIRGFAGRGIMLWGARTMSSRASWYFINVRRLFMMIEESVEEAMQWAVFESSNYHLWAVIRIAVSGFLEGLWRRGALVGSVLSEAFYVKCDETTMTQTDIDNGRLVVEIGVAPSIPAEFVVFRIGRVDEQMRVVEEFD